MKFLSVSNYQFLLIISLLAGIISGCAPTITSYQLEPASGDMARIDGKLVTKAEQNGVNIVASFEREDLEYVALDIEIQNHTDHSIDINPADFHFTALGTAKDTLSEPTNAAVALSGSAADPTYEAGRMEFKRKQEEKRLKRAKVFNTILMVAAIASDVSSSNNSRTYREYANNRVVHGIAYQAIAVKRAVDYGTFANRMQRYDYEEYRWRELALKANTLEAGQTIRGFVYLPKVPDAHYLAIDYSISEQTIVSLLFKQDLVQQKKTQRKR